MKYLEIVKTNISMSLMYKYNLFITSIFDCFKFIAEYAFWLIIFSTGSETTLFGYSFSSMLTYYLLMYIVGTFTSMGNVGYSIADNIKDGKLTNILIKPMNAIFYYFCESLGNKIPQFLCSAIFFIPIVIAFHKYFIITFNPTILFIFLFSLFLAIILTYTINIIFGMFVFWLTEISGLFFMKEIIVDLVSGKTFPIDIMPSNILRILNFLPFSYCTYFPIKILLGHISLMDINKGIKVQMIWILISVLLVKILWGKGIKRYEGTGM